MSAGCDRWSSERVAIGRVGRRSPGVEQLTAGPGLPDYRAGPRPLDHREIRQSKVIRG